MAKKGKFSKRGKSTLKDTKGQKLPKSLAEILGEAPEVQEEVKTVEELPEKENTDNHTSLKTKEEAEVLKESKKPEKKAQTKKKKTKKAKAAEKSPQQKKGEATVREEFRLPIELGEQLRRFAFEHRMKKTHIVREALKEYFERHQ